MININKFLQHVKVKRGEGLESYAGRYERIDKKFEQTAKKYRLANRFWFKAGIVIDGIVYRIYTTSVICKDEDAVTWYFLECLQYYFTHNIRMGDLQIFRKKEK